MKNHQFFKAKIDVLNPLVEICMSVQDPRILHFFGKTDVISLGSGHGRLLIYINMCKLISNFFNFFCKGLLTIKKIL